MKNLRWLPVLLLPLSSIAADSNPRVMVEPLYGIETSYVRFPEPGKYITRATYGLRALYGTTLLSGEAEFTQAKSREDYPSQNLKVEDTADRLALGLRSTIPLGQFLGFYLRAGGRAAQGKTIITTNGVDETKDNPLRIDPYAGAGLQFAVGSNIALTAGATMIRNQENRYDAQYTLALSARFGNR